MKTIRKSYNQITTTEKEQVIQMYYQGRSFSEMYDLTNLSKRNISKIFQEYHICTARKNKYLFSKTRHILAQFTFLVKSTIIKIKISISKIH